MKIAKKEVIEVKGLDWMHEIPIETEDFSSTTDIFVEAATRAVEFQFHSNPESFKLGSVVCVGFRKTPEEKVYFNSYSILCNASLFKMGENMRKKVIEKMKIDLLKYPLIVEKK